MIRINDETPVKNSHGCNGKCVKRVQGKTVFPLARHLKSEETNCNLTAGATTTVLATVGGAVASVIFMALIFIVTTWVMCNLAYGVFAAGAISILELLLPFGGILYGF